MAIRFAMGVLFSQPHKPNNGQMIPTPRWFTYLDTVARVGSIRKAADTLNVASTAINRMIPPQVNCWSAR